MQENTDQFHGMHTHGIRYFAKLFFLLAQNLLSFRRSNIDGLSSEFSSGSQFVLCKKDQQIWAKIFQHQPKHCSFTYSSPLTALDFLKLINRCGVKIYNIFEIHSRVKFIRDAPLLPNQLYQSRYQALSFEKFNSRNKNIVIANYCITDYLDEEPVMEIYDEFYIKVSQSISLDKIAPRSKRERIDTFAQPLETHRLLIKPDLAWEFGKISGDVNVFHVTRLAKLLGFKHPFLQARCALNLMIATFDEMFDQSLSEISITMHKQIYTGCEYQLQLLDGHLYRIVDGSEILATGYYSPWSKKTK